MFDSYRDLFLNCHVQPVRFALYYLVMQCCFRENHGTAVAVAFTSIFLAKIEKKSINNWSTNKPLVWKSIGIMTTFSVCRVQTKNKIEEFFRRANRTTIQPNSRLKYQTPNSYSWILKCAMARGLKRNRPLICKRIRKRQRYSNIQNFLTNPNKTIGGTKLTDC